ncbi:MAG: hypothetical protein ACFFDW_11225, partial [Candidatus Thorarchaeota archaeon]
QLTSQNENDKKILFYKIRLSQYREDTKNICTICKLDIRIDQNVYQCPVCLNYYHDDHLEEWLRNNTTCLICNTELIIDEEI